MTFCALTTRAALLTALLIALPATINAQTSVEGEITTTTWTAGEYRVTGAVTVPEGNTLTINAGVDVLFDADVAFIVEGRIRAIGTVEDSIRFVPGEAEQWRGVRISGGDSSVFAYVRVSGGYARLPVGIDPPRDDLGGGLFVDGSRVALSHSVFSANRAAAGGGLYAANGSSVLIDKCVFRENEAGAGAAFYMREVSSGEIASSLIDVNFSNSTGAATIVKSHMTVTGTTIRRNESETGTAGMLIAQSSVSMSGCIIEDNVATTGDSYSNRGSGLMIFGADRDSVYTIELVDCVIRNNRLGPPASSDDGLTGAGVYINGGGNITFTRCLFSGNSSPTGGGLSARDGANVHLVNCVFWNNMSSVSGGAMYAASPQYGTLTTIRLVSSIVWNNGPEPISVSPFAQVTTEYSNIEDVRLKGPGNIDADPLFSNPEDGVFTLQPGSPCIDTGNPYWLDADESRADMGIHGGAGGIAPVPRIDVAQDTLTVGRQNPGVISVRNIGGADLSIQNVSFAGEFSTTASFPLTVGIGQTELIPVLFEGPEDASGSVTLHHNDIYQTEDIVIPLSGVAYTVVSGNISGVWQATGSPYHVVGPTVVPTGLSLQIEPGVDVLFDADVPFWVAGTIHAVGTESDSIRFLSGASESWRGLRITGTDSSTLSYVRISDGYARGDWPEDFGGGLFVHGGSVGISNSVFSGNRAFSGGGGVCVSYSSSVDITNSTIVNNTADRNGGGLYAGYGVSFSTPPGPPPVVRLTATRIENNHAEGMGGGAHFYYTERVLIDSCTFADNSATWVGFTGGGGISLLGSPATITRTTIERNSSTGDGGGIAASTELRHRHAFILDRCTIRHNNATRRGGGGISASGFESLRIENSRIEGNRSELAGGGGLTVYTGTVQLVNSVFSDNLASVAGAMNVSEAHTVLRNSLVRGNTGTVKAGAIHAVAGLLEVESCTFYDNIADPYAENPVAGNSIVVSGREGVTLGPSMPYAAKVTNSIFWGGRRVQDIAKPTVIRVDVTWSNVELFFRYPEQAPPDAAWPGQGNILADPLFANPEAGDFSLLPGSPCIDTGSPYLIDADGSHADMGHTGGTGGMRTLPKIAVDRAEYILHGSSADTIKIGNVGATELIVTELQLPDSVTTDVLIPQSISPGDTLDVLVTSYATSAASYVGAITHSDTLRGLIEVTLTIKEPSTVAPGSAPPPFSLAQNAPNPFNPSTTLRFSVVEAGAVRLAVYDVNGRLVRTLVDGAVTAGHHEAVWDARDNLGRAVASGVYVYRLTSGDDVAMRRMVLVR